MRTLFVNTIDIIFRRWFTVQLGKFFVEFESLIFSKWYFIYNIPNYRSKYITVRQLLIKLVKRQKTAYQLKDTTCVGGKPVVKEFVKVETMRYTKTIVLRIKCMDEIKLYINLLIYSGHFLDHKSKVIDK